MAYYWRRIPGPSIVYYDRDMKALAHEDGPPEPWRRWARRIARHALGLMRGRL
ncbi:hypothetical protein ACFV6Y_38710 [Streptomyces massasporeus]|uniref:hypothetical protein n=1 Tax=Streptomyces massasporeus TaxID=67324 RepID=UPI00365682D3